MRPIATIVRYVPLDPDPKAYWRRVARDWHADVTLVNIEHDMEDSAGLVEALLSCPWPLCTHAYVLRNGEYAHSSNQSCVGASGVIPEGDPWCEYSGIGFCKIAAKVRVRTLIEVTWPHVEKSVNAATEGQWHVHWPVIGHYLIPRSTRSIGTLTP